MNLLINQESIYAGNICQVQIQDTDCIFQNLGWTCTTWNSQPVYPVNHSISPKKVSNHIPLMVKSHENPWFFMIFPLWSPDTKECKVTPPWPSASHWTSSLCGFALEIPPAKGVETTSPMRKTGTPKACLNFPNQGVVHSLYSFISENLRVRVKRYPKIEYNWVQSEHLLLTT